MKKNQSDRLTKQHKKSQGEIGIFGDEAKAHDSLVGSVAQEVMNELSNKFPKLSFRYRKSITKAEINEALKKIDNQLGGTLFLTNAKIIPDGGLVEVKDDNGVWRVVLVSEAKFQGKDIDNVKNGKLVGKKNDKDLMAAGNAIERSHKNISEMANYMLNEIHFPYILFLQGSNFLLENVSIKRPNGEEFVLQYDSGTLNRLDRLTAANYGMPLNSNLCINKLVKSQDNLIMLQAVSIFTKGNGERWNENEMYDVMFDIASTSIQYLSKDLFNQLFNENEIKEVKIDGNL